MLIFLDSDLLRVFNRKKVLNAIILDKNDAQFYTFHTRH